MNILVEAVVVEVHPPHIAERSLRAWSPRIDADKRERVAL
jgi:hypothetical protein